jgi:hypothetical protein
MAGGEQRKGNDIRIVARVGLVALLAAALTAPGTTAYAQSPGSLEQKCTRAVQQKVPWDLFGSKMWDAAYVLQLCQGTRDPPATIACFRQYIDAGGGWMSAIKQCSATPAKSTLQATAVTQRPIRDPAVQVVDPACLASAPWMKNPADTPLTLRGCRDQSAIPAPDADGWRLYTDPAVGAIYTRDAVRMALNSGMRAEVIVSGGHQGLHGFLVVALPHDGKDLTSGSFGAWEVSPYMFSHPPMAAAPPRVVDPACLYSVPWLVNPAGVDIMLSDCGVTAALPKADDKGWRRYDGPGGAYVEVRTQRNDADGVDLEVVYSGGGSGTFRYRVQGAPNAQHVLKAGKFMVTPQPER